MTKQTLDFALSVLSNQDAHTQKAYATKQPEIVRERQDAYTDGIRTALEIILTEGYTQPMPSEYDLYFVRGAYNA